MGFYGPLFRFCRAVTRCFIPRCRMLGFPPEGGYPVVFVSRHQNYDGMVAVMAHLTEPVHVWVLDTLTQVKSCQRHFASYTFTQRYHMPRLLTGICAKAAGWGVGRLLTSMASIPVHRGKREIIDTFRQTADLLHAGESVLIFPDVEYTDESPEAGAMYPGFVNLARILMKRYGQAVRFVPLYTSRRTHTISAGPPVQFNPSVPFAFERDRIVSALQASMNHMAASCGDISLADPPEAKAAEEE